MVRIHYGPATVSGDEISKELVRPLFLVLPFKEADKRDGKALEKVG